MRVNRGSVYITMEIKIKITREHTTHKSKKSCDGGGRGTRKEGLVRGLDRHVKVNRGSIYVTVEKKKKKVII